MQCHAFRPKQGCLGRISAAAIVSIFNNQSRVRTKFGNFCTNGVVHDGGFIAREPGRHEHSEFLIGALWLRHENFNIVRIGGISKSTACLRYFNGATAGEKDACKESEGV